jgi:hypothetical protein
MTRYIEIAGLPGEPLPRPEGMVRFRPKQIIHALYKLTTAQENGKHVVHLTADQRAYKPGNRDISEFIAEVRGTTGITFQPDTLPSWPADYPHTPLDIPVAWESYVVVQLDSGARWMFSQEEDAFTRKGSHDQDVTTGPMHIHPGTGAASPDPFRDEECMLCYFEVRRRKKPKHKRDFDCNVRIISGNFAYEIAIDPDVPNVGDPFPPDETEGERNGTNTV